MRTRSSNAQIIPRNIEAADHPVGLHLGSIRFYSRKIRQNPWWKLALTGQNGHQAVWHVAMWITRIPTRCVGKDNLLDNVIIDPVIGFDLPSVYACFIISVKCLKWILPAQVNQFTVRECAVMLAHCFDNCIQRMTAITTTDH